MVDVSGNFLKIPLKDFIEFVTNFTSSSYNSKNLNYFNRFNKKVLINTSCIDLFLKIASIYLIGVL